MNTLLAMFKDPRMETIYSQSELDHITCTCIKYLFKLISLPQFKRELDFYGLRSEQWRENCNATSDVAKVKLWVRYLSVYPHKNSARRFKLTNRDDVHIKHLILSNEELRHEIKSIEGQVFTWSKMEKVMAEATARLKQYARIRATKKLRFLCTDTGNDIEDFASDLIVYMVQGIYAKYPRYDSFDHLLNTGRTIINNMSINIIKHYTSQGRACKYQNADGTFSSHKVSLEALTGENVGDALIYNTDLSVTNVEVDRLETFHSVSVMANSEKKGQVIKLLMGYDASFSKWLVDNKKTTMNDNTKFQERLIQRSDNKKYLELIAEYLEVPRKKMIGFLNMVLQGLGIENKQLRSGFAVA